MKIDESKYRVVLFDEVLMPGDLGRVGQGDYTPIHHSYHHGRRPVYWVGARIVRKLKEPVVDDSVSITIKVSRATAVKFSETDPTTYSSRYLRSIAAECKAAIEKEEKAIQEAKANVDRLHALKIVAKGKWTELAKETKEARRELARLKKRMAGVTR